MDDVVYDLNAPRIMTVRRSPLKRGHSSQTGDTQTPAAAASPTKAGRASKRATQTKASTQGTSQTRARPSRAPSASRAKARPSQSPSYGPRVRNISEAALSESASTSGQVQEDSDGGRVGSSLDALNWENSSEQDRRAGYKAIPRALSKLCKMIQTITVSISPAM